ncbi:MAG: hypothetical protein CL677_06885 [Bdellovibrionaceae bacterium]|nr:hypothetical protein [Pseudobdellovibrionaceae bacterium]|tara:strand:+ start:17070 stop:17759 length:690 start_codon:yes stop_codon:yes gene_type:complete
MSKTAVVVGASQGIGLEIVQSLLDEGHRVIAASRNIQNIESLKTKFSSLQSVELDLTDAKSIGALTNAVEHMGGIDVLVFNAGVGKFGSLSEMTMGDWDRMFDTNAKGFFLIISALQNELKKKCAQVITITSDVSSRAIARGAIYAASKHAQKALIRSFQMEFKNQIRFTEIRPGNVATDFGGVIGAEPSGDYLSPKDVANAVLHVVNSSSKMRIDEIQMRPIDREVVF